MRKPKATLPKPAQLPHTPEQLQELICQKAYKLYEQRGKQDGRDIEDWVTAEAELTRNGKT